ncbi:MAG: hypothetical protein ABR548_00655, partial [Actinomycetota bacterium]
MVEESEWSKRLDRLMAGSLSEQVGSALEAIATEIREIAKRSELLVELQAEVARLAESSNAAPVVPDLSAAFGAVEDRLASIPSVADITAAVRDAVGGRIAEMGERLTSLEAALKSSFEQASQDVPAKLESQLQEIAARLDSLAEAKPEADVEAAVSAARDVTNEKVELMGRQVGAAIGRIRVQLESMAQQTESIPSLKEALAQSAAEAEQRITVITSALEERMASVVGGVESKLGPSIDQSGAAVRSAVGEMTNALNEAKEQLHSAAIESGRESVSRIEEVSRRLGEVELAIGRTPTAEQIAAAVNMAQVVEAIPTTQHIATVIGEAFDQNRQETERRVEAQTQQSAAVSARIKAALETLGTQMTQITQRLESLGDVQQVAQGIHGEVAALSTAIPKQIAAAMEEAARPLSESVITAGERVGGLSESLGAIRDRLETLPSPDHLAAALREERDAAERR